jgi:hypothetical protein
MVFPYLISLYKFVTNMKYMISQKKIISSAALLATYLSLSFAAINIVPECGTPFHGILDYDIDCDEEVLITSFPEDSHGTVILTSVAFTGKLRITPGASSVKILPKQSISNSSERRRLLPKSNNGRTGKSQAPSKKTPETLNYVFTNQYIGINDLTSPIVHYSIYDIYGTLILENQQRHPLDYRIPIANLNQGLYILRTQLENGKLFTKTFGKQ